MSKNLKIQKAMDDGEKLATLLHNCRAELIKKGLKEDLASELTKSIASAASSICDGRCGGD